MRKLLFSLLPGRDLIFKASTGSGPGGQHRNKTECTITLTHPESGVTVKAGDEKSQHKNKRIALRRLVGHKKFKTWLRVHAAMISEGYRNVEEKISSMMNPSNLKVENITTFICDGPGCKSIEKVVHTEKTPPLPCGWTYEDPRHFCSRCSKKR